MKLDVGCGIRYRGDVNVDLFPRQKSIPNLVKADAHFLPFISNIFDVVYCYHLIQMNVDYMAILKELLRVSKNKIEIQVPSELSRTAYVAGQKKVFTKQSFQLIFRNMKHNVKYARYKWRLVRHPFDFLRKKLSMHGRNRGEETMRVKKKKFLWSWLRRIYYASDDLICPIPTAVQVEVWK